MTLFILLIVTFLLVVFANIITTKIFSVVGVYSEKGDRNYQYQITVSTIDGMKTEMTLYAYRGGQTFDSILKRTSQMYIDNEYLHLKTSDAVTHIPRNMIMSISVKETKLD